MRKGIRNPLKENDGDSVSRQEIFGSWGAGWDRYPPNLPSKTTELLLNKQGKPYNLFTLPRQ
jgi:hypothetical protein